MNKKITKKEFIDVYNQHPPNKYVKFVFKHFSDSNEKTDIKLKENIFFLLVIFFIFGYIGTLFNAPREIIKTATISYMLLLVVMVLGIFVGVISNNIRIKKITKKLNIDTKEYNKLANKYL